MARPMPISTLRSTTRIPPAELRNKNLRTFGSKLAAEKLINEGDFFDDNDIVSLVEIEIQ